MPKVYTAQEAIKIFNELMRTGQPFFEEVFESVGDKLEVGRMEFHVSSEAIIDRTDLYRLSPDGIAHTVEQDWLCQTHPLIKEAWTIRSEVDRYRNILKLRMDAGFISIKKYPVNISLEEVIRKSVVPQDIMPPMASDEIISLP